MPALGSTLKYYTLFAVSLLLLVIFLPANSDTLHTYHLTSTSYHALLIVIVIPLIAILFCAFYGYESLKRYAAKIVSTPEGPGFQPLARGFSWLAWGLAINSVISILSTTIATSHTSLHAANVIFENYISLIVPLVAFSMISKGSRNLRSSAKVHISDRGAKSLIFLFMCIGVTYCYITFLYLDSISFSSSANPFHLPVWLIISTVIIPSLYTWFIGLTAAYEIHLYSKRATGVIYRKAMALLSYGAVAVIMSSIAVQYLHASSPNTGSQSLSIKLLIVNVCLVLMAIGYILVSLGSRKLRKIEEI